MALNVTTGPLQLNMQYLQQLEAPGVVSAQQVEPCGAVSAQESAREMEASAVPATLKMEAIGGVSAQNRVTLLATVDRTIGFAALLASLPIIATSALIIWVLARRTPFVAIARVGRDGRRFWMLKMRTMWSGNPKPSRGRLIEQISEEFVPDQKIGIDPRVTSRFAAVCRRFSIDELPQFWHVVTGEMSLVGPRPLTQIELIKHYGADAEEILQLRPGLTGLWQVRGRSGLSYSERRELDLQLARQYSWGLYWLILLRTIPCVVTAKNAW